MERNYSTFPDDRSTKYRTTCDRNVNVKDFFLFLRSSSGQNLKTLSPVKVKIGAGQYIDRHGNYPCTTTFCPTPSPPEIASIPY